METVQQFELFNNSWIFNFFFPTKQTKSLLDIDPFQIEKFRLEFHFKTELLQC